MNRRALGKTDLAVSAIGLGCGPLGDARLDDREAERVGHEALDLGINVFDTAPSYGSSEGRLGRALASRRHEALVVTKGGYGVDGVEDWSPRCITLGVDRALRALCTDVIDVLLLHSCDIGTLARGDLFEPLLRAKSSGKVRAIGYSGDGPALSVAMASGVFDVFECSVNVLDSSGLERLATSRAGVLAKRPLANAVWDATKRAAVREPRPDLDEYARRFDLVFGEAFPFGDLDRDEIFVRYSAHAPSVSSALVGTARLEGVRRAVLLAGRGPLPAAVLSEIHARTGPHRCSFDGVV